MPAPTTFDTIIKLLRKRSFAVLSTVDENGYPHAVGVEYGVSPNGDALYVMTRRQLKKARNMAANPHVALTVPLTRRVRWFLPPPSIQFQGRAEILDRTDEEGIRTFRGFFMGPSDPDYVRRDGAPWRDQGLLHQDRAGR